MRLIDADALVKCVNKIFGLKPDARWSHGAVLNTIDSAPTIGEWISVKDRLPKSKPDDLEYPMVIMALPNGSVELGCYYESTHEWGAGEWFDEPRKPIAWMPLPEPPEVKQDGVR